MLTVKQINEVSFGKAGFSGYKPEDVDNFIDEVAESFQQLEAERDDAVKRAQELAAQNSELSAKNAETQDKLAILAQKIESYRAEEDDIKDAILSAQKLARDSVQEAKDKAQIILQDAQSSAKEILDNAKADAAKSAREYMVQVEEKKEELEEIKRQVTAFRGSLLEMYKKHLECIDHIPVFRQKEKQEAAAAEEDEEPAEETTGGESAPAQTEAAPVEEPKPEPVPETVDDSGPEPEPEKAPAPKPVPQQRRKPQPTLHDRVNYTQEEQLPGEDDLSDVGIDLKTYSSIPESLRREKSNHFSNLEFGDDVDLGNRKRKK